MTEPLRVLDLFSGIGGFSLGLERTGGFKTVAFCEIEPFPRRVLAKHWPEVPCYDDVRTLTADRLRADGIAVDVICGGFPCQDLSYAGAQNGIGGDRSGLWDEMSRIIGEVEPRYAIIENVPALITGRDEYDEPNDRCLCGWPYRWRGLHQHSASGFEGVFRARRCGDERQGASGIGGASGHLWRFNQADEGSLSGLGRSSCVGAVRASVRTVSDRHSSAPNFEAGASGVGYFASEDDRWATEAAERIGFLDTGGYPEWQSDPSVSAGSEPQGADAYGSGGLVCEACGRNLDHASARSGVATWMGRVQFDLASLGYNAEWHCIPASAVGAPHERDRVWIVAHPSDDGSRREQQQPQGGQGTQPLAHGDSARFQIAWPKPFREDRCSEWRLPSPGGRWPVEPSVGRVAPRVPGRVDRIKGLGNSVVPQIPELIGNAILASLRVEAA